MKILLKKIVNIIIIGLFVASCATRNSPAPIVNATQVPNYSVLATPIAQNVESKSIPSSDKPNLTPLADESSISVDQSAQTVSNSVKFLKPTDGVIGEYSSANKGVNINGNLGQPIYAVEAGKVLYSGNKLKGYGNLIIIKHSGGYISAYAFNQTNYVHEGQVVVRGQKIAGMGLNAKQPMLHFEIRKDGKPIDPTSIISNN